MGEQLRTHLADFLAAYNFARRLKTLNGLTPYEHICKIWTSEQDRFILDPINHMPGLNIPGEQRFRLANSAEGHELLVAAIREMPGPVKIGFEATGGQEWVLWATLVAAETDAGQLPPAQIEAIAPSRGKRAKTDRIDAELIARFMRFRLEAGRQLPIGNLRVLRTLTTRRTQIVDIRKRLLAQIAARRKQDIPADVEGMDADLRTLLDTQVSDL